MDFNEIFTGKKQLLKYFKLKTQRDFRKMIGTMNHDIYEKISFLKNNYRIAGEREFKRQLDIKDPSFTLKSTNWFNRGLFKQNLDNMMKNDMILLDMINDISLKNYYEKLLFDLKNNEFRFSTKHQPVEIVKMLKMEVFLRKLFKS